MSAPTTDAPLTALDKDAEVSPGDLLAWWNEHAQRWRTFRVHKVVKHRPKWHNTSAPSRTIHVVRDLDAAPEYGNGTTHAQWSRDAGYSQINHVAHAYLVQDSDTGRDWVAAQRAIEVQDDLDDAARREADRVSPLGISTRLCLAAQELDRQASSAEARARWLRQQAEALRADAELVRKM